MEHSTQQDREKPKFLIIDEVYLMALSTRALPQSCLDGNVDKKIDEGLLYIKAG